jgi:LPXTG-site transpeptidase (sortase) family protein
MKVNYKIVGGIVLVVATAVVLNRTKLGSTVVSSVKPTPVSNTSILNIPSIGVTAPIVYDPSLSATSQNDALMHGVVHYAGTADPGQNGTVVLFGHSSEDPNIQGSYKFIFVLLDKLKAGDKFSMTYNGNKYDYQVTSNTIVPPTSMSVLDQTKTKTAVILTCWPVGLNTDRTVIKANQIN